MKISNSAKFPLYIVKGTVKERFNFANSVMGKFANSLYDEFRVNDEISLGKVKKLIKNALPYKKIKFSLKRFEDFNSIDQGTTDTINNSNFLYKYVLNIAATENDTIFKDNDYMRVLLHELWHFLDICSNPKTLLRFCSIEDNVYLNMQKFYDKYLYNSKINSKKEIKKAQTNLDKFLKKYDYSTQINILQDFRSYLQGEDNAERAVFEHYYKKFTNKKKFHPLYEEKISILNDRLRRALIEERKNIAKINASKKNQ